MPKSVESGHEQDVDLCPVNWPAPASGVGGHLDAWRCGLENDCELETGAAATKS